MEDGIAEVTVGMNTSWQRLLNMQDAGLQDQEVGKLLAGVW